MTLALVYKSRADHAKAEAQDLDNRASELMWDPSAFNGLGGYTRNLREGLRMRKRASQLREMAAVSGLVAFDLSHNDDEQWMLYNAVMNIERWSRRTYSDHDEAHMNVAEPLRDACFAVIRELEQHLSPEWIEQLHRDRAYRKAKAGAKKAARKPSEAKAA